MKVGWKHIWHLYGWNGLFSKNNKLFYFTFVVVGISVILLLISNQINLAYILIDEIIQIGLSVLPSLLGFNLGAYALIIGFLSNKKLLDALVKKQESESSNHLEKMSSVFAFNIIVQAFTLLLIFLIKEIMIFIKYIELNTWWSEILYNNNYVFILNNCVFVAVLFSTLYSICLVIQNVINIFDFNQLFTYYSLKNDSEDES